MSVLIGPASKREKSQTDVAWRRPSACSTGGVNPWHLRRQHQRIQRKRSTLDARSILVIHEAASRGLGPCRRSKCGHRVRFSSFPLLAWPAALLSVFTGSSSFGFRCSAAKFGHHLGNEPFIHDFMLTHPLGFVKNNYKAVQ